MGPPSRPVDKPTDTAELTDVIAQSGINLKDEESILTASFSSRPRYGSTAVPRYDLPPPLQTPGSGTPRPGHAIHELQQFLQGPTGYPTGGGSFSRQPIFHGTSEQLQEEVRKEAVYEQRRSEAHHANKPFLYLGEVSPRLTKRSVKRTGKPEIILPVDGRARTSDQLPQGRGRSSISTGANGYSDTLSGGTVIPLDASKTSFCELFSLATKERMRALLEDASALAINRRAHSGGVVPAEWTSLVTPTSGEAEGSGNIKSRAESVGSHTQNPRKRMYQNIMFQTAE